VPKVKLTARNVLTLRAAPGGRRRTYTDSTLPGFVLRVLPSGARRYAVRYGAAGDRSVPIGDARVLPLADARIRAKAVLLRVDKGEDPAADRKAARRVRAAGADTFESLAARLVQDADLADSTRRSWKWTLKRRVNPILGSRPPAEITRPELREAVARITERHGTTQANEALKVARWVLARALDSDLIAANPAAGIRKVAKERPRDRVLTVAELRSVWNAAGEAGVYGQGVRFAILTGARRSEVFRATWGEVDREAKLWRLPAARTKSRRAHEVPLTPDMTAVLDELPAGKPDARLFPVAPTSKEWRSLLAEAEIIGEAEEDAKASKRTRADRWPIRFHDLRRTFRNALTAELNVPPHVAEALVGHAESGLVRTYAPSGVPLAERRRALERWGRHVLAIAAGKRLEKVATFPGRAR
jgi:integrase